MVIAVGGGGNATNNNKNDRIWLACVNMTENRIEFTRILALLVVVRQHLRRSNNALILSRG
jgi:hypothetical protein